MDAHEVERFLSHLATKEKVAASTQRQAPDALVFLYKEVWQKSFDEKKAPVRSTRKTRLPTILTTEEVNDVFFHTPQLCRHMLENGLNFRILQDTSGTPRSC